VAHHPIIFSGLKQLVGRNYIERTVIKAIKHDIAIYAIHTNLDSVLDHGVNTEIANRLGLEKATILAPDLQHDSEGKVGAGLLGILPHAMATDAFLEHLKSNMACSVIKHTAITSRQIKTVAICGGSGGFLLPAAKASKADIFITSDYKYHEFFDADGDIIIADIGHYESEQFTIDLLHRLVSQKFNTFAAHKTKVITNPVSYFY
jgi:dinuclear metal center YbgI/SA1388 family protein